MRALAALDRWWLAPGSPGILATLRIVVGTFALGYLVSRLANFRSVASFGEHQFEPVGLFRAAGDPLPGAAWDALIGVAIASGVLFVIGFRYRASGLLFAVTLLAVTTYRNSWGQIFHVENLLVLHVLVLAVAPAADALSVDARGRTGAEESQRYGWPVRLMCLLTVLAYFVAGFAKLDAAGLDWAIGDTLRNQVAYDNLRKDVLGDVHSPLGGWLVKHGWLFPPLAVATLLVELGAPLAMFTRAWARAWALAAWLFHVGILALMAIVFPYQLLGVAFLPFLGADLGKLARGIHSRSVAVASSALTRT